MSTHTHTYTYCMHTHVTEASLQGPRLNNREEGMGTNK